MISRAEICLQYFNVLGLSGVCQDLRFEKEGTIYATATAWNNKNCSAFVPTEWEPCGLQIRLPVNMEGARAKLRFCYSLNSVCGHTGIAKLEVHDELVPGTIHILGEEVIGRRQISRTGRGATRNHLLE